MVHLLAGCQGGPISGGGCSIYRSGHALSATAKNFIFSRPRRDTGKREASTSLYNVLSLQDQGETATLRTMKFGGCAKTPLIH